MPLRGYKIYCFFSTGHYIELAVCMYQLHCSATVDKLL